MTEVEYMANSRDKHKTPPVQPCKRYESSKVRKALHQYLRRSGKHKTSAQKSLATSYSLLNLHAHDTVRYMTPRPPCGRVLRHLDDTDRANMPTNMGMAIRTARPPRPLLGPSRRAAYRISDRFSRVLNATDRMLDLSRLESPGVPPMVLLCARLHFLGRERGACTISSPLNPSKLAEKGPTSS